MDNQPDISIRTWVLALAIGVVATAAIGVWEFNNIQGGLGILALADKQLEGERAALRQELASQRETIEALKASVAKSHP